MPWPRRPLLIGAGALGSAVLALAAADHAATGLYNLWKPELESSLSRQLAQPVRLGRYAGLLPWGLRIGPSQIAPQGLRRSSVRVDSLQVTLAPLASLRRGLPTVRVVLGATGASLIADARGRYWSPPPQRTTPRPLRLALQLRLQRPAELLFPRQRRRYGLDAAANLQLQRRELQLSAVLRPLGSGQGGRLRLQGQGQWQQRRWRLHLTLQQMGLRDLAALLPSPRPLALPGQASGDVVVSLDGQRSACNGRLQLRGLLWPGGRPGSERGLASADLRCRQQTLFLLPTPVRWGGLQAQASAQLRWLQGNRLALHAFELRRGSSWIKTRGLLAPQPALQSRLRIVPADLAVRPQLPLNLWRQVLQGQLALRGAWTQPQLTLKLDSPGDPLLGPWQATLSWSRQQLQLSDLRSAHLQAQGTMPLRWQPGRALVSGPLQLDLALRRFPLQRLQPLLGGRLSGVLDGRGRISGPLQALVPDLDLELQDLGAGPLQLSERWQGHWSGAAEGGGRLEMRALAPAPVATLQASLNRRWLPQSITLQRGSGTLSLVGQPRAYQWRSRALLLDGLGLRLGPRQLPQTLRGRFSGQGELGFQPFGFSGTADLDRPALLGLRLQSTSLRGSFRDQRYQLSGTLLPSDQGRLSLTASGRWRGAYGLQLEARGLGRDTLQQLADLWPQWQGRDLQRSGRAQDLGSLMITTFGESLQQQLQALAAAQAQLRASGRDGSGGGSLQQGLHQLQARVDADLNLQGANLRQTNVDLAAKGHLWLRSQEQDQALSLKPFEVRLQGPLTQGGGRFDLQNLPLTLLALLTPVPESLRGSLTVAGRYALGRRSALSLELGLNDAELAGQSLRLIRGRVALRGEILDLDLALQAENASSSVDLAGVLPLDPDRSGLELRLASRGDGLRFLTAIAEPDLRWNQGSADLQLLLRGSVREPIANGFLRIRNGELSFLNQTIAALEATVVFDFEQLLVQELSARVGAAGRITASGHLGLVDPTTTTPPLTVDLRTVPFSVPRIQAVANGRLEIAGSLRDLQMGGEVTINRGSINAQRGRLVAARPGRQPQTPRKSVSQLLQENWDFQSPLLLVGAEVETNSSRDVLQSVPRFRPLGFNDLRLRLGPDLKIVIPNAASFKTAGLLRLSGRLDPSLRARGVLRLLQGRLNLFTTTFSLDPDAPNVAIFTPALGLVPYLDIAMRTRVADNLAGTGLGTAGATSLAEIEAQGGLNSLNQLNLVRITVSVSGPADRLAQTIRLRSSPPLPESRLIALIGGNSLAGLGGAGAGAAIATVVGQTLLSPVLGGLSDAFGQRLSFAMYPTYLNPNVTDQAVLQSQRLAPQLVLGSEIGLDVTERFNVSVLAAPNRSDVPPQINLNLRATDLINVQGAVDTQGAWQTQLQLFFRF